MRNVCQTCAAYGAIVGIGSLPTWAKANGSCRRRAPVDGDFMWPVVKPDGWCLEWQAKEDPF